MEYREDLKAYLDGELSASRTEEIRKALLADASLASEVQELQALSTTLRTSPQPQPYGLEQTLLALEAAKRRPMGRSPWGWWFGLGLAAAGCLAIGAVLLRGGASSSDAASLVADRGTDVVALNDAAKSSVPSTVSDKMEMSNGAVAKSPAAKLFEKSDAEQYARGRGPSKVAPNMSQDYRPFTSKPKGKNQDRKKGAPRVSLGGNRAEPKTVNISPAPTSGPPSAKQIEQDLLAAPVQADGVFASRLPVELKVTSVAEAEVALREMAAQYEGQLLDGNEKRELGFKGDTNVKILTLEVPEDQADKVLAMLKELPAKLTELKAKFGNVARTQSPPAGVSGGFAGARGGSGQAGGQGGGFGGGGQSGGPTGGAGGAGGPGGPSQNQGFDNRNQTQSSNSNLNLNRGNAQNETLSTLKTRDQNVRERELKKKATRKISIVLVPVKGE